ncbi:MAG: LTA synthase family protein [Thermoanaerobaculaceae bacterium]
MRANGFSPRAGLLLALTFTVVAEAARAAPPPLAWKADAGATPRLFWADRNRDITLRLTNLGSETWSDGAGDHLSYHWRRPDGTVVELDGMRARLPEAVRPGATVAVTARVHAPDSSGRWVLEWEMVREQVAWYGPPEGGAPLRVSVLVAWRCALLEIGFAVGGIALALGLRRRRPSPGSWTWTLVEAAPVVWTWLGVTLATVTFSEVARHQLWRGGGVLAASAAALVALPVALMPGRWRSWAAAGTVAVTSLVAVADALYLRFFENVMPLVALREVGQVGQIGGSVRALMRPNDAWIALGAAGAMAFGALWPRRRTGEAAPARARRAAWGVVVLACAAAGMPAIGALRAGMRDPATADQLFSKGALLGRWGFVNVHAFDILRTYREWSSGNAPAPGEEARVRAVLAARASASAARGPEFGIAKGANLVLIQVESLQQWVIGARAGGAEVTPFLNGLKSRALYFPFVFDETGQGRSSDGEFSVLNSQHPLDRGAVAFRRSDNRFVTLASTLRQQGYATFSAHPFEKGFWNRGVLHPRYGFERMFFRDELGPGETIGWGLADGVFFERMVKLLQQQRSPYFAFLITLGLHHPFDLFPDRHKVLDVGALKGTPLGNYMHAMHYFDASLAAFVAQLERTGVLSNTVVALYGDHESGLSIDDALLSLAGQSRPDPSTAVRLRRIPFFVLLPGGRQAGETGALGGHVDIAPTLLSLLGVAPPGCFVGHVLDGRSRTPAVLNDGSVVTDDRLFVAEGPAIPDGGACFAWPSGAPRPRADCTELARYGEEELAASRFVVLHDLATKFAAVSSP